MSRPIKQGPHTTNIRTERHKGAQTDRQAERQAERQRCWQTGIGERQTDCQKGRQVDKYAGRRSVRLVERDTCGQTGIWTGRRIGRQEDRQSGT